MALDFQRLKAWLGGKLACLLALWQCRGSGMVTACFG